MDPCGALGASADTTTDAEGRSGVTYRAGTGETLHAGALEYRRHAHRLAAPMGPA
jgi:hypothetical protein